MGQLRGEISNTGSRDGDTQFFPCGRGLLGRLLKLQMCLEKTCIILHCDTLTATNSCCLLQIDIQSTFSGVTLENNEVRC